MSKADEMFEKLGNKEVEFELPRFRTKMKIGNMTVMCEKHFNWLNKVMWKLLLGIEIEDLGE